MLKKYLPLLFSLGLIILWQLVATLINASYILPSPTEIIYKLWELKVPLFTVHLPATLLITIVGLVISVVLGLFLAVVMDAFPTVKQTVYPIVVASQTIPTTAIAPLFVLWLGYGLWSKVLVTILITFFPLVISVYDGLQSTKREMEEFMISLGASKRDIFMKLKVPTALPYFFSSLKMAIPLSIIGAAIGEWLGAQSGLGYFSRRMMTQLDGAGVFAPIVLLSLIAIILVAIISFLENRLIRWKKEI